MNVVTLLQKAGLHSHESAVDPEQLRDVVVGLYFSAHWCAQHPYTCGTPCTPMSFSGALQLPVVSHDCTRRCPPCRQFTPLLKQAYDAINASGKRLEIVFVSSDHDEKQFEVLNCSL